MVMQEGFNAARMDKRNADVTKQFAITQVEQVLKAAGVIDPELKNNSELKQPESEKISPEAFLSEEWAKQALRLGNLFTEELSFKTLGEYIATLPKFEPQPEQFKGRFDIPVIVETRVPLKRMLKLAGIDTSFDVNSIKDWNQEQSKTSNVPYTVWLNNGSSNLNKSVDTVRKSLKPDERGANIYEVIALFLKDSNILEHHYLDVPGSKVGPDDAPYLLLWLGKPRLLHFFVDFAFPKFGSVVAGKL